MKTLIFSILLTTILIIAGCKKEEVTNTTIINQGAIISTNYYSVLSNQWSYKSPDWYVDLNAPIVTQLAIDSGVVQVYLVNYGNPETLTQLPFYWAPTNHIYAAVIEQQLVEVHQDNQNSSTPPPDQTYKVVVTTPH